MRGFRVLCGGSTVVLLALMVLRARGQEPPAGPRVVLGSFAPSAIESGISPDMSRAPDSPETVRRLSLRSTSAPIDRTDVAGRPYVAGRVIVKFRDGASTDARVSALSAASST